MIERVILKVRKGWLVISAIILIGAALFFFGVNGLPGTSRGASAQSKITAVRLTEAPTRRKFWISRG